ncbi:MAG: alpha/beta hydrolase [Bacteroidales bacterium]|jgi:pimeloyl-ACP methyl ester carboxylesterase|nr:alpha/beta hydrolase [Bacteroidales bacterium]
MIKHVHFKNSTVRISDEGTGEAVLLLHGYLETLDIWDDFCELLTPRYRVIRMDIPGHGLSGVVADTHSMDMIAEAVETVLQHLDIPRCVLVGHSLGGYALLAYLANYPTRIAGICLFHSSPLADNEKKKTARDKEIRLVNDGKLSLICHFSIPNGFAENNLARLAHKVAFAKELALMSPPDGVTAILRGMRDRPDRQALLKNNSLPLLFLFGKYDSYIQLDRLVPLATSFPHSETIVLEHSGHSGYIEEPEKSSGALIKFIDKCYQTP